MWKLRWHSYARDDLLAIRKQNESDYRYIVFKINELAKFHNDPRLFEDVRKLDQPTNGCYYRLGVFGRKQYRVVFRIKVEYKPDTPAISICDRRYIGVMRGGRLEIVKIGLRDSVYKDLFKRIRMLKKGWIDDRQRDT